MCENESTENVTAVPADLYDQLMAEGPEMPDTALLDAMRRARQMLIRKETGDAA